MGKTLLAEMTWPEVQECVAQQRIAVVPVGAVEQHGRHLPVNVDFFHCERVVHEAAKGLDSVVVLPTLTYGVSHHHIEYPGTISLSVTTFISVLCDILASLTKHGFRKVAIINGHGGNTASVSSAVSLFLQQEKQPPLIATANYYSFGASEVAKLRESSVGGMAHAGEHETSVSLYLQPDLVQFDKAETRIPKSPLPHYVYADLLGNSAVGLSVSFSEPIKAARDYTFCDSGVAGDPLLATAAKGERIFELIVSDLVRFLTEFAAL
jgi:creatinine amidohydrolase